MTRQQIIEVQNKVSQAFNAKDASIFDAHLLVLEDPTLVDRSPPWCIRSKINVEAAFQEFADKYAATLSAIDDAYLRERAADMRDVTSRIMANLLGHRRATGPAGPARTVHRDQPRICPPRKSPCSTGQVILGFCHRCGQQNIP